MKRQSLRAKIVSIWCGVLVVLVACGSVLAQSGTSSVSGTVVDPQGNLVAGATVTLTNAQKKFTRTQTTSEDGNFAFRSIPPDQYHIEVEAAGFKKSITTDVAALVAKATTVTIALEVGND